MSKIIISILAQKRRKNKMDDFFKKFTLDTEAEKIKTIPELLDEAFDKVPTVTVPVPIYEQYLASHVRVEALESYIQQIEKHAYVEKRIVAAILGLELTEEEE